MLFALTAVRVPKVPVLCFLVQTELMELECFSLSLVTPAAEAVEFCTVPGDVTRHYYMTNEATLLETPILIASLSLLSLGG